VAAEFAVCVGWEPTIDRDFPRAVRASADPYARNRAREPIVARSVSQFQHGFARGVSQSQPSFACGFSQSHGFACGLSLTPGACAGRAASVDGSRPAAG